VANTRSSTGKTTAARAASRPAASRRATTPAAVEEVEVPPAEAQEIEAEGRHVTATLCDEDIRIIPPGAWRQSWQRLLNQGQIDAFAELVIHPDDLDLYFELDPTNEEFGDFVSESAQAAGEPLGNSRGPAPSSRRTRRR
jgi:hypothetical protein